MFEEYLKQPINGKLEMQTKEDVINAFGKLSDERMRAAMRMWFRDSINDIVMIGPTQRDAYAVRNTGVTHTYYLFSYKKDVFAVEGDQKDDTDRKHERVIKYSLENSVLLLSEEKKERAEFYRYVSREMLLQSKIEGAATSLFCRDYTIGYVDIKFTKTLLVTVDMLSDYSQHLW